MLNIRQVALACIIFLTGTVAFSGLNQADGAGMPTDLERVKIGDHAPDFTLEDVDSNRVSLSGFRDKKTVVLVFYRGYW